ncbi:MAG TPA: hypothetical protein VFB90_08565, partial [Dehalococcoidia bacterium]|nr:hypothetical protein [Dehalococcoidia bacterium]
MPTTPVLGLLNRPRAQNEAQSVIEIAVPLLEELINFSTHIFVESNEASSDDDDLDFPLLASFLHITEMADGVQVLVAQACGQAAGPVIRSEFESLLALDFLLQSDTKRRASAWWVATLHRRLRYVDMLDPSTPNGQRFYAGAAADKTLGAVYQPPPGTIHAIRNSISQRLQLPDLSEAE